MRGCEARTDDAGIWYAWYMLGDFGELEQIVNIPVSQCVEEIAEVYKSLIVWSSILNFYFEEIEVFLA